MKKVILIILLGIGVGFLLSYYIFNNKVDAKMIDEVEYKSVVAFQIGYFNNLDNAIRVADRNNGIVVNDNDMYRVYVAILSDNNAIELVSNYFNNIGLDYYTRSILVNSKFIDDIKVYQDLIIESDSSIYNKLLHDILIEYGDYL